MNADKLTAEEAFSTGAELWVLPLTQNHWWQEIDFRSAFQLSYFLRQQKKELPIPLTSILKDTEISKLDFSSSNKSVLLGTEIHFFNKWILIIPPNLQEAFTDIAKTCDSLKIHSIRLYGVEKKLIDQILARPSASLNRISFVE